MSLALRRTLLLCFVASLFAFISFPHEALAQEPDQGAAQEPAQESDQELAPETETRETASELRVTVETTPEESKDGDASAAADVAAAAESDDTAEDASASIFETDPDAEKLPVPKDVAAAPASAVKTDSGIAWRVLKEGRGEARPNLASRVRVHYAGWTTEGEQIENTYDRDEPPFLAVAEVIDGWREGLQLMVEGEKRRFWVPGPLAFEGRATMPQGEIVFDIELVEIINPPTTPEYLTGPHPEAEVHNKKGLASLRLHEGDDVLLPRAESYVTVHYTGWSTDGTIIDSSVLRGSPSTFQLTQVIKGWREGLQLMVAGEKRRFWIPEKLAYKGDKTKPQGLLIFDIELVAIPRY